MTKFNRKFNNSFTRFSFWNALTRHFSEFESLLQPKDFLTSEDREILRKIHTLLYQGYQEVKERREFHSEKMCTLIKEIKND